MDGKQWQLLKGLGHASNEFFPGGVSGIELADNKLYVSGNFTKAGDIYTVNVAEWDYNNSKWKKLDDGKRRFGFL
ncbi:MAG: hypothetical protein HC905_14290 [Bacteroidales bacterium]|nr:hypothetical protein [Bacteroidales bacterium]